MVAAFFAVPAMAQCTGAGCPTSFSAVDFSIGIWPENANVDLVNSGEQRAFGFWNGDAANDLTVEKDQNAGMLYQTNIGGTIQWDTRVVNIERITSGSQFATATGYATAKNSISVCSTQGTAVGCECPVV